MFKKKLSQMATAQDQEIKELEHNADMLLKREVKAFPYIQKIDIINKLLVNAKLKQYLALTQGNAENFKQEGVSVKYYEKCLDYEIRIKAKESLEKAKELLKVITDEKPIITVGDFLKSDKFKENVKKQAETILRVPEQIVIHDTARKRFKIEIEVYPADNERIQALKNDGFRRHQRSEDKFIDIYFKYI